MTRPGTCSPLPKAHDERPELLEAMTAREITPDLCVTTLKLAATGAGGAVLDHSRARTSRYRLQPHHINPHSKGGTHHPNNFTTLPWHHHCPESGFLLRFGGRSV
jgi:hypothetical protein